ncbi:sodium:solute symporter family protein [Streptomyces tagetis]|uniref:Sodium:solute symporter family protein n=1 Tax=Streptomyces tagetis TaxID=2820809 RepID=A0A941B0K6_9ACTN|nr:sodium:solute symporter family protein [Streptomyces sp. RG38]MBQ0826856.1 sodium:solute symporter family protein [Streptomyces sp. RG38]
MALVIVVSAFALVLAAASLFSRRYVKSGEDFYLAGRRMPWWGIGPTIAAGLFGGTSMLVVAGNSMSYGVSAIWILAVPSWIGAFVATVFFARKVRRLKGVASVPDIVALRYGEGTRTVFTIVTIFFYVGFTTSQLLALGIFINGFTGLPLLPAMGATLLVGLVLAGASGFLGVVITDGIMCVILAIGVGVLAVTGVRWAGGWSGIVDTLAAESPGHLDLFSSSITPGVAMAYVAAFGLALVPQQDILQRFASAKDAGHAVRGGLFALLIFIPLYLFPVVAGLAATVWLPRNGHEALPAESLVSWTSKNMYSPWVSAFLFLAVTAAILSTLTTTINSCALNVTKDIYLRVTGDRASPSRTVAVGRISTVLVGLVALLFATVFDFILGALYLAFSIAFAGMLVPIVAAFYWRRANGYGASWSALSGSGFVILDFALRELGVAVPWPGEPYSLLIAFCISLSALIAGSLLTAPPPAHVLDELDRSSDPEPAATA